MYHGHEGGVDGVSLEFGHKQGGERRHNEGGVDGVSLEFRHNHTNYKASSSLCTNELLCGCTSILRSHTLVA